MEAPEQASGARGARAITVAAVLAAMLPVIVATARALHRGWVPLQDDAFASIRASDVLSAHPPLVGLWTSASLGFGHAINHPGPLYFDLLAVPVRLFGSADGVAIGVGLVNLASIVGIAVVAHRRGGSALLVPAMLVTTALAWTIGSELLYEPWQPHATMLPFLSFLFLAWGTLDGDLALAPWAVGAGSLVVQTHLSYAYLVPALGLLALAVGCSRVWMRRGPGRSTDGAGRRRVVVVLGISAAVGLVCWVQPLIDQVTGFGNLGHLVEAAGGTGADTMGASRGARIIAAVLSVPPFWFRPSLRDTLAPAAVQGASPGTAGFASLPSPAVTALSLIVLVGLLVGAALVSTRRRDGRALAALGLAGAALGVGWFTAMRVPTEAFGGSPHNFRWLWPMGAFVLFALLAAAVPALPAAPRRAVLATGLALTVLVSALALPVYDVATGPTSLRWAEPGVRDLDAKLAARLAADPPPGPVLTDFSNTVFLEPYSTPLLAQLQRSGVEFVTEDEAQVHNLGRHRRYDGHGAVGRFVYRLGDPALEVPRGEERLALHRALDRSERRELERLRAAGSDSTRREELEGRRSRETIGVFVIPLDHPARAR